MMDKNQIQIEYVIPFSTLWTMQNGSKTTKGKALKIDPKERTITPRIITLFVIGRSKSCFTSVTGMA
jgi:hypothetical protein